MSASIATAGGPLIDFRDVTKSFGNSVVIDNLSFHVAKGEIVGLLGRTGAGKSTVMNLLLGAMPATRGSVRVAGHDPYSEFQALRGKLAVSFQTDRLLPWRTAVENVELGLLILGTPKDEARRVALQWLDRVKLDGAADKYPHELSGGMRQRVSLARALAVDPQIVFLDESFSQLDHVTSQVLRRDFGEIARRYGKTCVFVTHRIDDAIELADRVLVLAAPARLALELSVDDAQRSDPTYCNRLHDQIAQAMGGVEL